MVQGMSQAKTAKVTVREACEADLGAILDIYNHYVLNTCVTFDIAAQSASERARWYAEHKEQRLPVYVAEVGGQIAGWGSLSYYHTRCAYKQTLEPSIYVAPSYLGYGVGRALGEQIMEAARQRGCHALVCLIWSENKASLSLVSHFGYQVVGTLREVGRKDDRWLDVTIAQKIL